MKFRNCFDLHFSNPYVYRVSGKALLDTARAHAMLKKAQGNAS